jgi:hypothetical protein
LYLILNGLDKKQPYVPLTTLIRQSLNHATYQVYSYGKNALYAFRRCKVQISFGVQHIQTEGFHLFLKLKVNSINTSGQPPSTTLLISQDLIQYYTTCTVETAALNNTRLNQINCIRKRQHSTSMLLFLVVTLCGLVSRYQYFGETQFPCSGLKWSFWEADS